MNTDIMQMWVGRHKVGVIDARRIFIEVRELRLTDAGEIEMELLERAGAVNYIPASVEADYREALYREYRRFCGETVPEVRGAVEIRVLGPGCLRCDELMRRVMAVVAELDLPADVQHIHDLNQVAAYGPAPTPVLVVNGKIITTGKVPSPDELRNLLRPDRLTGHRPGKKDEKS
jgi:small redox-active disulfide protein 2